MLRQDVDALEQPLAAMPVKPLLRGWSHAAAAVSAVVLTTLLCWRSAHDTPRMLSLLIFGASMTELYTVSAVYHLGTWRAPRFRLLRLLDHSGIFVAIASSYTPLCFFSILNGWMRTALLACVWLLAVTGIALKIGMPHMSRRLSTALYVGMGWSAVFALPAFWAVLPLPAVSLLGLAGGLYTVAALIFRWRWPDPFPRIFGFHEIFHLLVIGGSAAIAIVVWIWVAPRP